MVQVSPITGVEPEPVGKDTPTAVAQFHAYWVSRCGNGWAPRWADIDLLDISPEMIRYVVVSDILGDGDLYFRYWGSGHAMYYDMDYSHRKLSDMHFSWLEELLRYQYDHVIATRKPWVFKVRYVNLDGSFPSYRAPLSNDGETVTGVISFVPRQDVESELRAWHFDPPQ